MRLRLLARATVNVTVTAVALALRLRAAAALGPGLAGVTIRPLLAGSATASHGESLCQAKCPGSGLGTMTRINCQCSSTAAECQSRASLARALGLVTCRLSDS